MTNNPQTPDLTITLGMLTISTATRSFVGSTSLLLITTFGVGAGIAIVGTLIGGFAKKNFAESAAQFMGIYAMSLGLGSTISASATGFVVEIYVDWRIAAGVWAFPALGV